MPRTSSATSSLSSCPKLEKYWRRARRPAWWNRSRPPARSTRRCPARSIEVNEAIVANPELVNQDPEGDAWFLKLRIGNTRELDPLMSADAYKDYLETVD